MATYQGPLTDPGIPAGPAVPSAPSTPKTPARAAAEEALLDAAERLLADAGYAAVTTRRLAEEAGVNHGLVHYYFGSNENLLVRALERFTERLDRPAAGAIRGRPALRGQVADGDALPDERGRQLPEDLA